MRDKCRRTVDDEKMTISQAETSKTPLPPKFEADKWVNWEIIFINHLSGIYGITGVPLHYVVCKSQVDGYVPVTNAEKLVFNAPLQGDVFQRDTQAVFRILKSVTARTDAWEWIKQYDKKQDGRLAFEALRKHYDGPGEVDCRIALAKQQIRDLFYNSEQAFPFEKFITKLNGAFQVLAECKEGLTEKAKLDELLSSVQQCTNPSIIAAATTVMMSDVMQNDFIAAANKMTEVVAKVFPSLQLNCHS